MVNLEWNHFGPIPSTQPDANASAESLYLDLKEAFPDFVADFERKFTAWKDKWFSGDMRVANNASDRCYIDEYEPVLFLGPEIIPLVVYELTKPENFFATSLYNHLESHKKAKVDRDDVVNYHTLQRHANLLVELNHERAQHARERINAWKAHCAQQQQAQHVDSSGGDGNLNSDPDTACKEYDALVEMGPGITALVMLEYSKDQTGPWFLLMHHFVYEKPLELGELGVLDVKEQYARWKDWMELGEERHELAERLERGYVYNFYIRPGTTLVGGVV